MSAESLEQPRPDTSDGDSGGPMDGAPDHTVVTVGVNAVLAVVAWAALGKDSFDTASAAAGRRPGHGRRRRHRAGARPPPAAAARRRVQGPGPRGRAWQLRGVISVGWPRDHHG
ncbi:hypothetical protein [Streptomyces sp. NBC_01233]|uniref:hypothetical protein n=1 Tax=Streptomyces sp. NBC_01233 TaxID=2903787 RepID=UPI002E0DF962|nr:hypothetical protein OG332_06875 [Streptomyces sp. NBC_01233]